MVNRCKCGCGTLIPDKDERGRPRYFVPGHFNNLRDYKPLSKKSIEKMKITFRKKYPNGRPIWNRNLKGKEYLKHFKIKPFMPIKKGQTFKDVYGKNKAKNIGLKMSESRSREKNYNWKGGIYNDKKGYVWIKSDIPELNTYHKKYAKRCNVVWYKKTGEIIKFPYFLHHKNENKKDDRFKNLEKVTRPSHLDIHRKKMRLNNG